MEIIIKYDSKWSASFLNEGERLNSMAEISKSFEPPWQDENGTDIPKEIRQKLKEDFKDSLKGLISSQDSIPIIMEKVRKKYPAFLYQPITKNTVLGILARLMGEIKPLSRILENSEHFLYRYSEKISFTCVEQNFYNEKVLLHKPIGGVQNNGGGFVPKEKENFPLIFETEFSKLIYAMFALSHTDLKSFLTLLNNNNNLAISFNKNYKEKISAENFLAGFKGLNEKYADIKDPIVLFQRNEILNLLGKPLNEKVDISGLILYAVINFCNNMNIYQEELSLLIPQESGTKIKKNVKGFAPDKGTFTIREFYLNFSPKKLSWTMPYMVTLDNNMINNTDKAFVSSPTIGLNKECGVLKIKLDIENELTQKIKEQMNEASVSTFYLGKKGLAYVVEIKS